MENVKAHDHMSCKQLAGAQLEEIEHVLGPVKYPGAEDGVALAKPADAPKLPEFVPFKDIIEKAPDEPPMLIEGLVHRGDKVMLGAESKAGKTWLFIQMALSIAAGLPFLGRKTTRGVVLYINFELKPWAFSKRVYKVAESLGITDGTGRLLVPAPPDFMAWHLRGVPGGYDIETLCQVAEERLARMGLKLAAIIIDPLYKSYGGRQENDATDMAQVLERIEQFGHRLDAAIFVASHFAKGDSAGKAQIDRISGSGVIARDPDSIVTLSKLKDTDCHVLEATLRNMASPEPAVVQFEFPTWKLRPDMTAAGKGYSLEDLVNILPTAAEAGLTSNQWFEAAVEQGVCTKKSRFTDLKDQCLSRGLVKLKNGPRNSQIYSKAPGTSQKASE